MAVWFIFWGAFATVVKSMVENVVMPPIGLLLGKVDFSNLFFALDGNTYKSLKEVTDAGAPAIKYGAFLNDTISFVILGFVIFMMIRALSKLQKKEDKKETPPAPPAKPDEVLLLEQIRDALVKKA